MRTLLTAAALAAAGLVATPVLAQNKGGGGSGGSAGPVLIDQARAEAGGVTPGDAPGFPVTISVPGSYRLAGNLNVADATVSAIEITASNVTLDLGGFAVTGPLTCSGANALTIQCQPASTHRAGVMAPSTLGVTVRDGKVRGFGYGVTVAQQGSVLNVDVNQALHYGILAGHSSLVAGNRVSMVRFVGIASSNGIARDNTVYMAQTGVLSGFGGLVQGNRISWTHSGISGQYGSTSAKDNVLSSVTTFFTDTQQLGPNACNAQLC